MLLIFQTARVLEKHSAVVATALSVTYGAFPPRTTCHLSR
jgi:hypothetical protein